MYRNVRPARTVDRVNARRAMERGAHSLVLVVQGERSTQDVATIVSRVVRWWEDLRRSRQWLYGPLLRFLDASIALGTSREVLQTIPTWLAWYIDDRCDDRDGNRGKIKLVA